MNAMFPVIPAASLLSAAVSSAPSALYLRLPPHARASDSGTVLPFAVSARGRVQRVGHANLGELSAMMRQAQRVILLLAGSDVSLFRMVVPPLPPARLRAALPALVEDRVIGDPADCAIAAGPPEGGERLLAVTDRGWLMGWLDAMRRHGARRVSALPFSLCLPLPAGQAAAALVDDLGSHELVLRLSADEGTGLPLAADELAHLPAEAFRLLSTFASGRAVQLSMPPVLTQRFREALATAGEADIELREEDWAAWIEGAGHLNIDLAAAVVAEPGASGSGSAVDWRLWRWPLILAASLLLFNVAALNWDWWRLAGEGQQLREAMERSFRRSFPNETLVDPVAQLRQKLTASRQASGEFASTDFVALATALGDAWPGTSADPRAIASLDYRDGALKLRFKPGQQPALDPARAALAARGLEVAVVPGDGTQWQLGSMR